MTVTIGRRELLAALGGAAGAWPLAAGAQQPGVPVIGYLAAGRPETNARFVAAFRKGLSVLVSAPGSSGPTIRMARVKLYADVPGLSWSRNNSLC